MTARREYTGAIVACVVGAGLVLLALRQGWARVNFHAPAPLPSGSVSVTGQDLMAAVSALALAALACLAAVVATRGWARRVAGVLMAGLGLWIAVLASEPVRAASVIAAAAGTGSAGGYAGSAAGGTSAIAGNATTGNGLPVVGAATRVALTSGPWRTAAVAGAIVVIAAGLIAAWRGPRWPVMSARYDRPAKQPAASPQPSPADSADRAGEGDAATLWEALDRGVDLTEAAAEPASAEPASAEPASARTDQQ